MNRASMLKVSFDPGLRAELASLGLVQSRSAADANAFRAELRPVLAEIGPRIRALKQSGELQRLLEDPGVRAAVGRGDGVRVCGHPAFGELFYRAAGPAPPADEGLDGASGVLDEVRGEPALRRRSSLPRKTDRTVPAASFA